MTHPSNQPPHDSLVCGIEPDTSCPACRAARWPESPDSPSDVARRRFEKIALLHGLDRAAWREPTAEDLTRFVLLLSHPKTRELARELHLDLIGDDIADIALVVREER
jgi:hypothetical protein